MQKVTISKSREKVKELMKEFLKEDATVVLKNITDKRFRLISHKNYGNISMVEKQRYSITGILREVQGGTEISFESKGNATFKILCIILPIMMLPTAIIGNSGNEDTILSTGISIYLISTVIIIVFLLRINKKLELEGERDFRKIVQKIIES